ncbi:MAG: hypothetical protein ABSC11_09360 [Smithella sp.]
MKIVSGFLVMDDNELFLRTNDKRLINVLRSQKVNGLEVSERISIMDSAIPKETTDATSLFLITLGSQVAIELFKALLKKFAKTKHAATTTINNIEIHNNYEQVMTIGRKSYYSPEYYPREERQ